MNLDTHGLRQVANKDAECRRFIVRRGYLRRSHWRQMGRLRVLVKAHMVKTHMVNTRKARLVSKPGLLIL
jgi:hypothetical protein